MREGMRTAARLIASEPYRAMGAKRSAISDAELEDDAALDRYVARHMGTSIHMASSCRMGSSPDNSVVDQHCRVHGIEARRRYLDHAAGRAPLPRRDGADAGRARRGILRLNHASPRENSHATRRLSGPLRDHRLRPRERRARDADALR
jgi:hypothetical protein